MEAVNAERRTDPTAVAVAFVGLGAMGGPMAGHLVRHGHPVRAFNRTRARAETWAEAHPGRLAASPAEAAHDADVVCICVGDDPDVREVVCGPDGVLATMRSGTILVDHTTASATLAVELAARAAAMGVDFVDAPVSGGQAGAQRGRLSVMCGGDAAVVDRLRPLIGVYAARVTHMGPVGHGQLTKMVNQVLCAAAIEGAAEALNLAEAAGLDPDLVMDAVTGGAGTSWYLENRGADMLRDRFEPGFAVRWIRKDLRICREQADRLGVPLPLARLAEDDLTELQRRGDGALDATAVIRLRRAESSPPP